MSRYIEQRRIGALPQDAEFDLVVAGSGAAGLSAAAFAAVRGARVLVVERSGLLGGTSALTAGTLWIPGTDLALAAGAPKDDAEIAARFLARATRGRSPDQLREAYLATGPDAVRELVSRTRVSLAARTSHPDYMQEIEDATARGHTLETSDFDASRLRCLGLVRTQSPEMTVFGGMMLSRTDLPELIEVARGFWKPANWGRVVRAGLLLARHLLGRLTHPRATRMTMGNALVGSLLATLEDHDVPVAVSTTIEEIITDVGRVSAVRVRQGAHVRTVRIRRGLISATGGFNRHPQRRQELLPGIDPSWSGITEESTGQLHELLEAQGAYYGPRWDTAAFWAPVSLPPRRHALAGVYPHFSLDRAKPGFLAIDRSGRRFVNESTSYHRFGVAMQHSPDAIPSWLVCDRPAMRRYGIGAVRPGGWGRRRRIKDGYLIEARTLEELAARLKIDSDVLEETIRTFNEYARTGSDRDFHRGTTVYERSNADPSHQPNPSLGALRRGPFYAIRLYPGDIGTVTGFVTDACARVLTRSGDAIPGLYVVGNDMQSVMGDSYPGPGITLGPAVVFAYIAVRDALGESSLTQSAEPGDAR